MTLQDENGNNLSGYYPRYIVLANIDSVQFIELIVTALPYNIGDSGYIYVIDSNDGGTWSVKCFKKFLATPISVSAVGNFDYDGIQGISVTTNDGWLYILNLMEFRYKEVRTFS